MRPGTFLGWTSALCTLLIAALLAGGLHWALTTAAAYPTPAAQTVNQNDAYDVTTAIGVMAGVALLGLGACTALVLWLHHRTTRPVAAGRRGDSF